MSMFSEPIKWSNSIAKTKFKVFLFSLVHFAFITWGLHSIYETTTLTPDSASLSFGDFLLFKGVWFYFIGVAYPTMYLYVIYRLLKVIKQTDG